MVLETLEHFMWKSKKILLIALIYLITHAATATGVFFLCRKMTVMHVASACSSLNLSKSEEFKMLLKTIIAEVRKDPGLEIGKMEKLHKQIPDSYEGFRTKEELEKAGIKAEDMNFKITFDLIIETESDHKFKSNITLDLPTGNILQDGVGTLEDTQLENVVFKRF